MTPTPPRPRRPIGGPAEPQRRRVAVEVGPILNVLGLLLLLGGGAWLLAVAWQTHTYLGQAVTAGIITAAGWRLATSEA